MLPVVVQDNGLFVADPDTGQMVALCEASDRVLAMAAAEVAEHDRRVLDIKRALAAELRERHGVGTAHAGGYRLLVAESVSWPVGATSSALSELRERGVISQGEVDRCLPSKPKPDGVKLKALIGRLTVSDPEAAKLLADAATVSPPSVRDVQLESVDAESGATGE